MQSLADYWKPSSREKHYLIILIFISFLIRLIFSSIVELTNDEVNYWTYALYPSLSYFDHPPMVGWLIRITTFNLTLTGELFVRLSSILIGVINSILIFKIGKRIKNEQAGIYAALLYNASLYCFIITGIFIMPDTPQLLFWLLSSYYFLKSLTVNIIDKNAKKALILSGLFVGLALLSKYHSIFLWFGALLYIILYNRKWLKAKELYISLFISLIIFLPVLIWNYHNNFISFTFQSERVDLLSSGLRFDYFITEILGEIIYNNPVLFILFLITLFQFKKIKTNDIGFKKLLLFLSLPNILIFLLISLFRKTLPHWSGPGYVTFIILIASYITQKDNINKICQIPVSVLSSLVVMFVVLILGYAQINYSVFNREYDSNPTKLGKNDITLDMYGWSQVKQKFGILYEKYLKLDLLYKDISLISNKWYNAAHIDYYIGRPLNKKVYCAGNLNDIRNYYFVNNERGEMEFGKDAFYISPSRDFKDPNEILKNSFLNIIPLDTIHVLRNGDIVENVFVYKLSKYNGRRFY